MTDQNRLDTSWALWKQLQESLGRKFIKTTCSTKDEVNAYTAEIIKGKAGASELAQFRFFKCLERAIPCDAHSILVRRGPEIQHNYDEEDGCYSYKVTARLVLIY